MSDFAPNSPDGLSLPPGGVAALLDDARGGDADAAGRVLQAYRTYLGILVRGQLGPRLRGKVDSDDIVQATFLDAHRQLPKFRGTTEGEWTAWLRAILAGQLALVMRKFLGTAARDARLERQLVARLDQSSMAGDDGLVDGLTTPSGRASRRERAVLLAAALDRLPPDYRRAIVLRTFENLPFAEVARQMDRTEDAVRKLWLRGLTRLRAAMTSVLGEEEA